MFNIKLAVAKQQILTRDEHARQPIDDVDNIGLLSLSFRSLVD